MNKLQSIHLMLDNFLLSTNTNTYCTCLLCTNITAFPRDRHISRNARLRGILPLLNIAKLLMKVVFSSYSYQKQNPHILTNTLYCQTLTFLPISWVWIIFFVLICISLISNEIEHVCIITSHIFLKKGRLHKYLSFKRVKR